MARIWFTSDHHFGHANIIKYTNRPFQDVAEMDRILIERWNDEVKSEDIVYHLGDFCLCDFKMAHEYFSQLNGLIHILADKFHHDKHWIKDFPYIGLESKQGKRVIFLPSYYLLEDKVPIVLSHFPFREWNRKHYGAIHLHGHSHGNLKWDEGERAMDVGVDTNNFSPYGLDEIYEKLGV